MEAIHKNDLSAYLSDWKMKMETMNKSSKIDKNKPQPIPETFQAIFIQTIDLSVMLRYLDSNLRILENSKSPFSIDYQAYADAIFFFKSFLFVLSYTAGYFSRSDRVFLQGKRRNNFSG